MAAKQNEYNYIKKIYEILLQCDATRKDSFCGDVDFDSIDKESRNEDQYFRPNLSKANLIGSLIGRFFFFIILYEIAY